MSSTEKHGGSFRALFFGPFRGHRKTQQIKINKNEYNNYHKRDRTDLEAFVGSGYHVASEDKVGHRAARPIQEDDLLRVHVSLCSDECNREEYCYKYKMLHLHSGGKYNPK